MSETPEKDFAHPNTTVSLTLKSWGRFKTPNLRVDPGLLGACHSFAYKGKSIKISLPIASEVANADRIKLDHWREREGDRQLEPMDYLIHSVDVSVAIPGLHILPTAVLEQPANAFDIISPDEQNRLELLATTAGQLALEAFDLWIRCVRWKTGFAQFGRAATVGPETGWGIRLRDASSDKMVWIGTHSFVSPARSAISPVHWANMDTALAAGDSPPVFVDLLMDAEMHMEAGDFRRSVIDASIALETYVRTVVQSTLPDGIGEAARRFIDEGNIRPVLERLFPEALDKRGKAGFKAPSELHQILNDRNSIMHSGSVDALSREKCVRYVAAVRKLTADHIQ